MKRKKKGGKSPAGLLGLVALGVASGVVGAFVIGPRLSEWTDDEPARLPAAARVRPSASTDSGEASRSRNEEPEDLPRVAIHSARTEEPEQADRESSALPPISDRELAELTYDPEAKEKPGASEEEPVRVAVRGGDTKPTERERQERESARREQAERDRREGDQREAREREARERAAREQAEREKAERERAARQPVREAAKPAAPVATAKEDTAEPAVAADPGPLIRVRLGRFKSREEAEKFRAELGETPGAAPAVVRVGTDYRIQVGAFRQRENVDKLLQELRSRNYRPEVVEEK